MKSRLVCVALLLAAFAACSDSTTFRPNARDEVETAMQNYGRAVKSGSAQDIAAFYLPDGQLILPKMAPLTGPDAIVGFLQPITASTDVADVQLITRVITVRSEFNFATMEGSYSQLAGPKRGEKQLYTGDFDAEWHYVNGEWRIKRLRMIPKT